MNIKMFFKVDGKSSEVWQIDGNSTLQMKIDFHKKEIERSYKERNTDLLMTEKHNFEEFEYIEINNWDIEQKRRIDCMTCKHFDRWSDSCPYCHYEYDSETDCEVRPFAGKIEK